MAKEKTELSGYDLSRMWFDWAYENPERISPNHAALYFFIIEHCNRLGWKQKFGLPTTMAKDAIGIRSYNTYINTLSDLIEWGFVKMIEKSKNQYSANIIALSKNNKTLDKALDKAFIKHVTKQRESTSESIDSIDKQITIKPINNKPVIPTEVDFLNYCKELLKEKYGPLEFALKEKLKAWVQNGWKDGNEKEIKNWKTKIGNVIPYLKPMGSTAPKIELKPSENLDEGIDEWNRTKTS
jgi:hypothetical protein